MDKITFQHQPRAGYCHPETKTALLLARLRINILSARFVMEFKTTRRQQYEFEVEYLFDPGDEQKSFWPKMMVEVIADDYETAVQWVIYRVNEARRLNKQFLSNPESVELDVWE